jgi:septal ring factor EnvC (AmiA/AmiB activator)
MVSKMINFRRNHQRAIESMQISLESETKGKSEAIRLRKKLEQDINELEMALDASNRGKQELEKSVKRYSTQLKLIILDTIKPCRNKHD